MMTRAEFDEHLSRLDLSQTEAARLMSVSPRTLRRWAENPTEIPGPAEQALRAWLRLHRVGIAWRPDGLPLGEHDIEEMAKQIALYRQHAIDLDAVLQRVYARGGPDVEWQVDVEKGVATLGPMRVAFYRLPNGSFSPSTYRRSDRAPDIDRDARMLEDAYASIAKALRRPER
jgi:hypothetical protein